MAKYSKHEILMLIINVKKYIFIALFHAVIVSCGGEKKQPVFYDSGIEPSEESGGNEINSEYDRLEDANTIAVPYIEKGGVKYVQVSVNGFGFEMVFDTGCSSTLVSVAEANYLYQKGYLTNEDIIGISQAQIADGSIVENMVVNLKEVIIDGKIKCQNVTATVSANNNAPLLLGNEVLDRVAAYSVDNENQTIYFRLK